MMEIQTINKIGSDIVEVVYTNGKISIKRKFNKILLEQSFSFHSEQVKRLQLCLDKLK